MIKDKVIIKTYNHSFISNYKFLFILPIIAILFAFTACERNDMFSISVEAKKKYIYYAVGLSGITFKTEDFS